MNKIKLIVGHSVFIRIIPIGNILKRTLLF